MTPRGQPTVMLRVTPALLQRIDNLAVPRGLSRLELLDRLVTRAETNWD
jgi:hypothetical protein